MIPIVDHISNVVALMPHDIKGAPFFYYGHLLGIQKDMITKDKNAALKDKKFPAVLLKLDTIERVRQGVWDFNLNIAIVAFTDRNYTTEQRYTNVFKPVLYPLYNYLLKALQDYGRFEFEGSLEVPDHDKADRPYWGTESKTKNTEQAFLDPLDAIEIMNLRVNLIDSCPGIITTERGIAMLWETETIQLFT